MAPVPSFPINSHAPASTSFKLASRIPTSIFSITSITRPRLSMNEFVATRNMRFVVALYSTRSTEVSAPVPASGGASRANERRTSGESSLSTAMAVRAMSARRWVGKGIERVLEREREISG